MTDEQSKELQSHLQKNLEILDNVIRYENDERQSVKKNLETFHQVLNDHEKILNDAADRKRAEDEAELDDQLARLKNFIAEQI